jgi:hypothetical protein
VGRTGTANKYTQKTISDNWTQTDANGETYLGDEINGMNQATKRPSNFVYCRSTTRRSTTGTGRSSEGVYYWGLPLAAGVIPAIEDATYQLVSWNRVSNSGHYLELHGYEGRVGSSSPDVYFSDTAGTYADSVAANWKQASSPSTRR